MWVDTRETLQLTRLERAPGVDHLVARRQADRVHELDSRRDADPAGPAAAGRRAARSSRAARWSSIVRPGRPTDPGPRPRATPTSSSSTRRVGGTPRQVTTGNFNHSAPSWSADGKIDFRLRHSQAGCRVSASATPRSTPSTLATGDATRADRSQGTGHRSRSLARRPMDRLHRLRPEELHESPQQPVPDGLDRRRQAAVGRQPAELAGETSRGRRTARASTTRCRRRARRTPGSHRPIRACRRRRSRTARTCSARSRLRRTARRRRFGRA